MDQLRCKECRKVLNVTVEYYANTLGYEIGLFDGELETSFVYCPECIDYLSSKRG